MDLGKGVYCDYQRYLKEGVDCSASGRVTRKSEELVFRCVEFLDVAAPASRSNINLMTSL